MKHRHGIIVGAFAAVVLAIGFLSLRLEIGGVPVAHASASGEILSPVTLAPDERIQIDYSDAGCRSWHNWMFVLLGGPERRLAAVDAGGSHDVGIDGSDNPTPVGAISLSEREGVGMGELLEFYRHPDSNAFSTTTIRIRASYYRGEKMVGAEEFIDNGTVDYWLSQRDEVGRIPITAGVTPDMISFRQLMQRAAEKANQTLGRVCKISF